MLSDPEGTLQVREADLGSARLVYFQGASGHHYAGVLYTPASPVRGVVVHVHGTLGNFYANPFIQELADEYNRCGLGLLSFNLRAHDGVAEGVSGLVLEYVGGCLTGFGSCVDDIASACEFVRSSGYQVAALQGHSLGCERVLAYVCESSVDIPLVLLCPVDTIGNQVRWDQHALNAVAPLQDDSVLDLENAIVLRTDIYGALGRSEDWQYPIPTTEEAWRSLFQSEYAAFFAAGATSERLARTCTNATGLIVASPNDSFVAEPWKDFAELLDDRFPKMARFSDIACDHDLQGVSEQIADAVIGVLEPTRGGIST